MNTNFNLNRIFSLSSLFTNIYYILVFMLTGSYISAMIFVDLMTDKIPGGS